METDGKRPTTLISIIIVNYNAGTLLTEGVQAALASELPVEVFVSDNGSTDDSIAHCRKTVTDPRLHIIENHANLGFAAGNNRVLPHAQGDFLLFLNPDCVIQPHTLTALCDEMAKQPDVGMAGCLILNTDGTEQAGCRRSIPTPWKSFTRAFGLSKLRKYAPRLFGDFVLKEEPLPTTPVDVDAISGAFMLVRRSALSHVGSWDEGYFLHCEDLDWCMRFKQAGWRILFVPQVTVMHVKGACSQGRPIFIHWHMHKGMVRFYRKFFQHQYPWMLMLLVTIGVWLRFIVCATSSLMRRAIRALGVAA